MALRPDLIEWHRLSHTVLRLFAATVDFIGNWNGVVMEKGESEIMRIC